MSANAELAAIFAEMASVLQITGQSPFRVNAHARVARILGALTSDVAEHAPTPESLTAIAGIGKGSAAKILEYLETGRVAEHQELLKKIPGGLLDLLGIQGLGPKTIRLLWQQAGVTDLATLQAGIDSGELEHLPRLGPKAIANISRAIEFARKAGGRTRLGAAMTIAQGILAHLRGVKGTSRLEYAGSLRRGAETIGDIDILAATADPDPLRHAFERMPGVQQILAAGPTRLSLRHAAGIQIDLRIVAERSFGAAWMYFTGSKQHNVQMRERAIKRKMRLNEYGLFPDDGRCEEPRQERGVEPVAGDTEAEVFAALGLPMIPPEIREDLGELELAKTPRLIEQRDIKSELHAHTVASDGRLSIDQLAREAMSRGFHTVAVTDHSAASAQANGLSADRLRRHIDEVRRADRLIDGISILAGAEVDILADGRLDYTDDLLRELDIVVASPHIALRQEPAVATKRLLRAIRHPLVNILGHPTGRMINRREGLSPDIAALVQAARECDVALEINANDIRLDLRDIHIKSALAGGALLAINTDAHAAEHFDYLRYGILTARRGWLTPDRCINTWSSEKLHRWLRKAAS